VSIARVLLVKGVEDGQARLELSPASEINRLSKGLGTGSLTGVRCGRTEKPNRREQRDRPEACFGNYPHDHTVVQAQKRPHKKNPFLAGNSALFSLN
jgi:hypothetical protein